MKIMKNLLIIMLIASVLSACTAKNEPAVTDKDKAILDAELMLPKEIALHQEAALEVRVTQGGEAVEDAVQVQFAIWRLNSEGTSTLIEAKHEQDGIYRVNYTFEEDGVYSIQSHVSARSQHVMPKRQIAVGSVSEEELRSIQEDPGSATEQDSHQGHH